MLKGKFTIVAFNSVGFPYAWDTNIIDFKQENNRVTITHKPKGKRTAFKHTYDKDNELKVYNGWLGLDLMKNEMMSFDSNLLQVNQEPVFTL